MSPLTPFRTCFSVTCPRLDENDGINRASSTGWMRFPWAVAVAKSGTWTRGRGHGDWCLETRDWGRGDVISGKWGRGERDFGEAVSLPRISKLTSPRPRVPASPMSRPHTSPILRPHASPRPTSPNTCPRVPVPLFVTAIFLGCFDVTE